MMVLVLPPRTEQDPGPIELSHRLMSILILIELVKNAMKKGELPEGDPLHYLYFYNAVALGAVMVTSPIYQTHGRDSH